MPAASAIAARPSARALAFGMGAKLMARTSAAISTTETIPPKLSTGSEVSLTCPGTNRSANTIATAASGSVIRNTEPHS